MSKVIENVVAHQLKLYLSQNNLVEIYQSTYTKSRSIEKALLRVHSDLCMHVDSVGEALLIMFDLSAAFDTLDRAILLNRLEYKFGITARNCLKMVINSNRYQFIQVSDVQSNKTSLEYGVPQGSVLGPLLFTMYVSPLVSLVQNHNIQCHMNADDTQIYIF